jgi:hypothetical protein
MKNPQEESEQPKDKQETKSSINTEVTEADWEDFFANQEDFNSIFDR